jgi:nitroreductase
MELRDAIRTRRSVRAYRPEPIPAKTLEGLVELANLAPSAGNLQGRDFVVVREETARRVLARAALDQDFLAEAPVVVVVCANLGRTAKKYGRRGRELYAIQDAAAATENLLLAAHEAGLGTCWVGAFDEEAVRKLIGLPADVRPVALIPLGVPAEEPEPSPRLPLKEILHLERW